MPISCCGLIILCPPFFAQVDVTSKTEGRAFADSTGVPLLVKYDTRLREGVAKNIVEDVTTQVQVSYTRLSTFSPQTLHCHVPASYLSHITSITCCASSKGGLQQHVGVKGDIQLGSVLDWVSCMHSCQIMHSHIKYWMSVWASVGDTFSMGLLALHDLALLASHCQYVRRPRPFSFFFLMSCAGHHWSQGAEEEDNPKAVSGKQSGSQEQTVSQDQTEYIAQEAEEEDTYAQRMAKMKGFNKLLHRVSEKVSLQRPQCLGGPAPATPQPAQDGKVSLRGQLLQPQCSYSPHSYLQPQPQAPFIS